MADDLKYKSGTGHLLYTVGTGHLVYQCAVACEVQTGSLQLDLSSISLTYACLPNLDGLTDHTAELQGTLPGSITLTGPVGGQWSYTSNLLVTDTVYVWYWASGQNCTGPEDFQDVGFFAQVDLVTSVVRPEDTGQIGKYRLVIKVFNSFLLFLGYAVCAEGLYTFAGPSVGYYDTGFDSGVMGDGGTVSGHFI